MTHVELSLSSSVAPDWRPQLPLELARWVAAVTESAEPALIIDASAVVIACTPACVRMLGLPHTWTGERLRTFGLRYLLAAHCTGMESTYRLRHDLALTRQTALIAGVGSTFELGRGISGLSLSR